MQQTYKFTLEEYLEPQPYPMSGLGYIGLTLVSCQKIFIFLGDLVRYREIATDTSNYGKAKRYAGLFVIFLFPFKYKTAFIL